MKILTDFFVRFLNFRRRSVVFGLVFVMLFTAVSICCVYAAECREKSDRAYRESATLVNFRFRDELQYRGMRGYDSSRVNFVDETENFNYDGEMEKYDYTVNMTRDYFDRFAGSDEVENYNLSYIEKVYSTAYEVNSGKNESLPFALVGGKIDNFLSFRNEFFLNGYYSLILSSGRYPEAGECLISKQYAVENGLGEGSVIDFCGDDGDELLSLKVSGTYAFENRDYQTETGEVDLTYGGCPVGTTPYGRIHGIRLKHFVFCSFNEAYYAYGDEDSAGFSERHVFDKYIAWYRLDSPSGLEKLRGYAEALGHEEIFGFYPADRSYELFGEGYRLHYENMAELLVVFPALILLLAAAYALTAARFARREVKTFWRLGMREGDIKGSFAAANLIVPLVCVLPALPLTKPAKALYESGYAYLRYFPTSGKLTGGSSLLFLAAVLLCLAAVAAFSALGVFIAVRKR
ncbi:MAG: hypothetical protein ACOX4O_11325 [Eubacteriales bacterium]|jgi:hypothetical protein